ncbi:hypothetical protein C8F01DRAFT_1288814 [Mycena amicta]|nr:hypothetical protein C8F01DRAFT_1288814 [Mycena amicta]
METSMRFSTSTNKAKTMGSSKVSDLTCTEKLGNGSSLSPLARSLSLPSPYKQTMRRSARQAASKEPSGLPFGYADPPKVSSRKKKLRNEAQQPAPPTELAPPDIIPPASPTPLQTPLPPTPLPPTPLPPPRPRNQKKRASSRLGCIGRQPNAPDSPPVSPSTSAPNLNSPSAPYESLFSPPVKPKIFGLGFDFEDDSEEDEDFTAVRAREGRQIIEYNAQPGVRGTHKERVLFEDQAEEEDFEDYVKESVPERPRRKRSPSPRRDSPSAVAGPSRPRGRPPARSPPRPAQPSPSQSRSRSPHRGRASRHSPSRSHSRSRSRSRSRPQSPARSETARSPTQDGDDHLSNHGEDEGLQDDLELDEEGLDETVKGRWDIKPGPPPNAAVESVKALTKRFYGDVAGVGRKVGCKVETLLAASGVVNSFSRDTNRWGAFQAAYREDHPREEGVSPAEWAVECRNAYRAVTAHLTEDELKDPFVIRELFQPYIDRFLDSNIQATDHETRKSKSSVSVMQKTVKSLISRSSAIALQQDFHVVGVIADLNQREHQGNNVIVWGGSDLYNEARARHGRELDKAAAQLLAVLQATKRDMQLEEEGEQAGRNPIDVELGRKRKESKRDAERRQVTSCSLNSLYLALLKRGMSLTEIQEKFATMPWRKWLEVSVVHQLRWIYWPVALAEYCPGSARSLTDISNKKKLKRKAAADDEDEADDDDDDDDGEGEGEGSTEATSALRELAQRMTNAYRHYQGDEELLDTYSSQHAPCVESWTADEMALEDPSNVPVVVARDGTILFTAASSKGLSKLLDKRAKKKSRTKSKTTVPAIAKAPANPAAPPNPKKRSAPDTEVDQDGPPPKRPTPAQRPAPAQLATTEFTRIKHLKCRFTDAYGRSSEPFHVEGMRVVSDEEDQDEVFNRRNDCIEFFMNKEWQKMAGFTPAMTPSQELLARVVLQDIRID